MSGEKSWIRLLAPDLLANGRRVGEELAWTEMDAVRTLDLLTSANCRVLGVDTWTFGSSVASNPTVLGPDWDHETCEIGARQFVLSFKNRPDIPSSVQAKDIWFNFTAEGPAKAIP